MRFRDSPTHRCISTSGVSRRILGKHRTEFYWRLQFALFFRNPVHIVNKVSISPSVAAVSWSTRSTCEGASLPEWFCLFKSSIRSTSCTILSRRALSPEMLCWYLSSCVDLSPCLSDPALYHRFFLESTSWPQQICSVVCRSRRIFFRADSSYK